MRVLVACEFSGKVRDAFLARGHDAVSCDVLPTEAPGPHLRVDVCTVLDQGWDLMVAFPPCTYLAASGARYWEQRQELQREALMFFWRLWLAPIPRVAIENPVGAVGKRIRPADQVIQPWQYGHGQTKATCLWLRGLPPLRPTFVVHGRRQRVANMTGSNTRFDRRHERSRTLTGVARAMAAQWG
jgi:hypothetical protein